MSTANARGVFSAIPALFGKDKDSDCDVLFRLELLCPERKATEEEEAEEEQPRKRPRLQCETVPLSTEPHAGALVGEPLPGHLFVLRLASERLRAQIERWDGGAGDRAAQGAGASSSSVAPRPQLHVPLGSEAEVPFARAAIGFASTGVVAADGVRAALEVRRQAAYLQIDGCTAACDELLLGMLAACSSSSRAGSVAAAADRAGSSSAAVEFMACWAQLPDPAEEPTFSPVLAAAKQALVRHFGDAQAAFNTPSSRQQLLQLPAAGVEALLGSEAFGTDSEDSVLLLLATWMKANHGQTDAATRRQLCRLVQLVQLGRPYLTVVVPVLAADHETGAAGSPCAWFPISIAEAGFITTLATAAAGVEKDRLLLRWPTCLPEEGRTFEWVISQQELREALDELEPEEPYNVDASFAGDYLCARGLEWKLFLEVEHEATSAGIFITCILPAAYYVTGSSVGSSKAIAVVGLEARLAVHGWRGGARQTAFKNGFEASDFAFDLGRLLNSTGRGWSSALPLAPPQQAGADGGGGGDVLTGWAPYLRDGRLTGTLTLLPVP